MADNLHYGSGIDQNKEKTNSMLNKKVNEVYQEDKKKVVENYEDLKKKGEEVAHDIRETASHLYEEGKHQVENLKNYIDDYSDELIKMIKNKPLTSVLVAGGVGYLLAKLLKQ